MLQGATAFLAIWHDIDPALEAEWHRWHTYEHMPERVGIPGFLAGRRYMSADAPAHRCFTLYEGSGLGVFNSPAYLERLNAPTPWTREMAPAFRNFVRGACRRVATAGSGNGYGGAVLTVRIERSGDSVDDAASGPLAEAIAGLDGIVGAHVGLCEQDVTRTDTNERALRSATGESTLDGVVIAEAYELAALETLGPRIEEMVAAAPTGLRPVARQTYTLAFMLRE